MEINHYKETLWTGKVVTLCGFSMVTACSQFWTYPCAKMLDLGRWFIIWKAPMLLRWFLILKLLLVLGRQLPLMLYNITEEINLYTIPNTLNRSHAFNLHNPPWFSGEKMLINIFITLRNLKLRWSIYWPPAWEG